MSALFGQRLILTDNPDLVTRLDPAKQMLERITAAPWTVLAGAAPDAGPAVLVRLSTDPALRGELPRHPLQTLEPPVEPWHPETNPALVELRRGARSAYLLHVEDQRLWIVANTVAGAGHGVYDVLHRLGARFYMPTPRWTLLPSRTAIKLDMRWELRRPSVDGLFSAGNGDAGAKIGAGLASLGIDDLDAQVRARWDEFRICNRAPTGYLVLGGHRSILSAKPADPLLLAEPRRSTGRGTIQGHFTHHGEVDPNHPTAIRTHTDASGTARCEDACDYTSHAGFVALLTDELVREHEAVLRAGRAQRDALSVEPADGDGICTCLKCRALLRAGPYTVDTRRDASPSDLVAHVGNHVVAQLDRRWPGLGVSWLAYSEHVAPPTIPIARNTLVQVAAYGQQQYASADAVLQSWSEKQANNPGGQFMLGGYVYWSTFSGLAGWDSPGLPPTRAQRQLASYLAIGARYINIEGSWGGFPMGLHLHLACRTVWGDAPDDLTDELVERAFEGLAPIRRLLDRWFSGSWRWSTLEMAQTFADLEDALAAPTIGQETRERIEDIALHAHYLRLLRERFAPPGGLERVDALLVHAFRCAERGLLSVARLHELIIAQLAAKRDKTINAWVAAHWGPKGDRWAGLTPYSSAEIAALVTDGAAQYPAFSGGDARSDAPLVPLFGTPALLEGATSTLPDLDEPATFALWLPPGRPIEIVVKSTWTSESSRPVWGSRHALRLLDDDGSVLENWSVPVPSAANQPTYTTLSLPPTRGGALRLVVDAAGGASRVALVVPNALPIAQTTPLRPYKTTTYAVFVPDGVTAIAAALFPESPDAVLRYTVSPGVSVTAQRAGETQIADATGHTGKVWTFTVPKLHPDFERNGMMFLNIPHVVAHRASSLLVPADRLPS